MVGAEMMLSYDARTQPDRGSGLGQIFNTPKPLRSDAPLESKTMHIAHRLKLAGRGAPCLEFISGRNRQAPRPPVAAPLQRVSLWAQLHICPRDHAISFKNFWEIPTGTYFYLTRGDRFPGWGAGASGGRCASIVFRKIGKGTALKATPHKHNQALCGSNRALPALSNHPSPSSTMPIPTSAPTGLLSQLAQRIYSEPFTRRQDHALKRT
jgi:hypothetical protein